MGCFAGVVFLLFTSSLAQDPFTIKDPVPGDKYTSNGVAWGDWDGDGWQDVYIGNGAKIGYQTFNHKDFLYRNNQAGGFEKITQSPVVSAAKLSGGATWGDFDNDGDLDLYTTTTDDIINSTYLQNKLFLNNAGAGFTECTTAGLPITEQEYSCTAGWGDYDNDGRLDLFLKNGWEIARKEHSLYHNQGDGTFAEIAASMCSSTGATFISGFSWCDYDMDGDLDLFTCSGAGDNNNLWRNDGVGSFANVGSFDASSANGCSWADIDNDGDFDLFVANYGDGSPEDNFLYMNNGDGTFTKNTTNIIAADGGLSMGSAFGDIDNDGDLDLFVANDANYETDPNFLYINDGSGGFTKNITSVAVADPMSQAPHGVAFADYNNDGFLDLYAAVYGPNFLLENNGNANNWILINLEGTISAKTAIGAKVWATATIDGSEVTQLREVFSHTGMASNNSYRVHFGFGDATVISELKIEFPPVSLAKSSATLTYTDVQTNQIITITEDGDPIAIRLLGFDAGLMDDGQVHINWHTASEINTAGFFLQKSEHQKTGYKRVNSTLIPGAGRETSGATYNYQDAVSSACYYRIEEICLDGTTVFSEPVFVSRIAAAVDANKQPLSFALSQNYPNPFNPTTTIHYELPSASFVKVVVFDVRGRRIRTLYAAFAKAGAYDVIWDGADDGGKNVASGIYFCKLNMDDSSAMIKMLLAR